MVDKNIIDRMVKFLVEEGQDRWIVSTSTGKEGELACAMANGTMEDRMQLFYALFSAEKINVVAALSAVISFVLREEEIDLGPIKPFTKH